MVYLGTYKHNLDPKNRLSLPSKLIDKLSKDIYISKGLDNCLEIRVEKDYTDYSNTLQAMSTTSADVRKFQRTFYSSTNNVEIDSANRILIPANLLEMAKINKEITIIGVGNKIELWDSKTFDSYYKSASAEYEAVAEKLYANKK